MSHNTKFTFELNNNKFTSIISKIVNIYEESKNYFELKKYHQSYYNLLLASNLVNILKESKIYSSLDNQKLRITIQDFIKKIELMTQESKTNMTNYYKNNLNQLIQSDVKEQLNQFILLSLKINNLDNNRQHLLLSTSDQILKTILIKYIIQNCQTIANLTIIEQDLRPIILKNNSNKDELNNSKNIKTTEISTNNKIVIIYNNIDLVDEKLLEQLNKINNLQIYFIFSCTQSSKIDSKFTNHLFHKIDISLPSLPEITNYIRFRVLNYLSYQEIIDNQYPIDILKEEKLNNISEKLFQIKLNYSQIDNLINSFLKTSFNISLKNNLFNPIKLKKKNFVLIDRDTGKKHDRELVANNNSHFLFKIPKHKNIIIDNKIYRHIHFCSHINFNSEDYNLTDIFILEDDMNKTKGKINIIGSLNIPIKSEFINHNFDTQMELSKLVINLYLILIKIIVSKIKNNSNQFDSKYNYLNNLDLFKTLINSHNLSLLSLENITQFNDQQTQIIFTVLDNYLQNDHDDRDVNIEDNFNKIFSQNYYTYLLNIENLEVKIYFAYNDHIEHLYLSDKINIAEAIRSIILKLYQKDSTVEIVKNINYYLLNIEILENGDLSELKIYLNEKKVSSFSGIPITDNSFDLPPYYCFTNENDIQLLTEKFPKDYSTIYYEDDTTWKFNPIKLEHQEFLKDNYCLRTIFYLNILNFLLLFQKYNDSLLNQEDNVNLENLIFDIQMIVDSIIYKTSEIDNKDGDHPDEQDDDNQTQFSNQNDRNEKSELNSKDDLEIKINNRKVKNLIWSDLWYRTDNLKVTNDDEDEDDYNYQRSKIKLKKKYYINLLLIKNILKILGKNKNILSYYQSFKNKLFNYENNQEIFIKSSLNLSESQHNIYSNYQIDNYDCIIKNNTFLTNIIGKLSSRSSLYFQMFNNLDYIIVKDHKRYLSYKVNKHNSINDLKQIGQNIIKNENYNSLISLGADNNSEIITKWLTSFILSSIISEYRSFDFCNIFIGCLIYNNYISNDNNDLNLCQLINIEPYLQHIVNKINYVYSITDTIYELNYKQIFQLLPEKKIQFLYCSKTEIDNNKKILEQHNILSKDLNTSIINCNLKEEYFEDIIQNYSVN